MISFVHFMSTESNEQFHSFLRAYFLIDNADDKIRNLTQDDSDHKSRER